MTTLNYSVEIPLGTPYDETIGRVKKLYPNCKIVIDRGRETSDRIFIQDGKIVAALKGGYQRDFLCHNNIQLGGASSKLEITEKLLTFYKSKVSN